MAVGLTIRGGRVLGRDGMSAGNVFVAGSRIVLHDVATELCGMRRLDATGLVVLPGLVDIHGDAFERQIMPRPGVQFDLDMALLDTDRQLVASGITTACHGVTCSWEPGLRTIATGRALLEAIERLRPRLAADTIFHLRHETFNLDAEAEILGWIAQGRIGVVAFNDHMAGTIKNRHRPEKMAVMIQRSGLSAEGFGALVDRVFARHDEVPGSIARIAAACRAARVPLMSHDDMSPAQRRSFKALGCGIAEFPVNEATAVAAAEAGDAIVFGAPNVVRGGSHTGCPAAASMVARGQCTILASDYYYPALLAAPFKLAADGVVALEQAWPLVSRNPAVALGLDDRGLIAPGLRADLILVDPAGPRVVATLCSGRLAYLADADRLDG